MPDLNHCSIDSCIMILSTKNMNGKQRMLTISYTLISNRLKYNIKQLLKSNDKLHYSVLSSKCGVLN